MVDEHFKKKRKAIQLVSSAFFILIILGGLFYPLLGYFAIVCMIGAVSISFFNGRKWCDFCPRGSFFDVFIMPISKNKKIPKLFTGWRARIFAMMLLMTVFAIQLTRRWPDLYSIGSFLITFLIITTLVGILLGIFIQHRTWCRFCPMGSIANLIGGKKHPLNINSEKCTDCGICSKVCPMQLNPSSHKKTSVDIVNEPDCIKCVLCVNSCPKGALR